MSQARALMAAMIGSVVLVAVLMLYDEQREFEHGLITLEDEQQALATAVAADLESRLRVVEQGRPLRLEGGDSSQIPQLLGGAIELEQPGSRILLVATAGGAQLYRANGRRVHHPRLQAALATGVLPSLLERPEAAQLGLPARLAALAMRSVQGRADRFSVVVIASAARLRTRERRAQLRFLLGVAFVTTLVAGFGGLALRDQRHKLQVARELEVAALQRERERLLGRADKMATLAALSSGIAHQIATPLGTIVARVEQVLPAVSHLPKATMALQTVVEQVVRIQRVISGVLDLARGNRPTLVSTQPEAIVHGALSLVQHRLSEAGIETKLTIERGLSPVACDPPMLEQALANLLLNACEAGGPDSTLEVRLEMREGSLRFVVEDEGEGIADDTAARAKEPFFTTKAAERGTGLGLAIAQEVVAHHGGRLHLARRGDVRGTRATIELPV